MTSPSAGRSRQQLLAERFAPVLMLWPEIPADRASGSGLRNRFARSQQRSATRTLSGAHVTRDFHPRDIRLLLNHAQAWDPRPPLPIVSLAFTRAYRDFARYFFWPIAAFVLGSMLVLAMAQALTGYPHDSLEIAMLVLLGGLYLTTLRSPVLTPVDYWHHLNHITVAVGVAVASLAVFGTSRFWYISIVLVSPSAVLVLTSLLVRDVGGFVAFVILPLRFLRALSLWAMNRRGHSIPKMRRAGVIVGVKAPNEYSVDSELFFRHPRDGKPIHRSDRDAHWVAYSRIMAREGDRYPITYYARVVEPDEQGITAIQYWFGYFYNDWANEHEGDWETAMVLVRGVDPVAVAASSHEGGELRDWRHVQRMDGHPVLYVAAGSHAMYFESGAFVAERAVAGLRVTSVDAALFGKEILDYIDFTPSESEGVVVRPEQVVLIPDPDPVTGLWGHPDHDPNCPGNCELNLEWLNYQGHWGAVGVSLSGGFSGPRGPSEAGLPWDNPFLWSETVCRPCPGCVGGYDAWRDD